MNTPASRPVLRPTPMDVGDVVAGAFGIFRRRFGLFVLLTAAPIGLIIGLMGGLFAIWAALRASLLRSWDVEVQLLVGLGLGYLVLTVAAIMAQLKFSAMTCAAAAEVADGRAPALPSLWDQTKGVTARLLVFMLIGVGATLAVITVTSVLFIALLAASLSDEQLGLAVIALVLFIPVLIIVGIYFGIRLLYVIPVASIERASNLAVLRRSWALTRGSFWRTFGYAMIASLIVNGVSTAAQLPMQAGITELTTTLINAAGAATPADVMAMLAGLPWAMGGAFLLAIGVQLLAAPFQLIYHTVMYIDQVRRDQLDAQAAASPFPGYPQAYYPPVAPQQSWTPSQWGYPPAQPPASQPPAPHPQASTPPAPQPWPTNPDQPWSDSSRQP